MGVLDHHQLHVRTDDLQRQNDLTVGEIKGGMRGLEGVCTSGEGCCIVEDVIGEATTPHASHQRARTLAMRPHAGGSVLQPLLLLRAPGTVCLRLRRHTTTASVAQGQTRR